MSSTALALMFAAISYNLDLPPGLLEAVCKVESDYKHDIIHYDDGSSDSIGLCQLKLATAHFMGYRGDVVGLLAPATNAYYAGMYIRHHLYRHDNNPIKAISAYNAGRPKLHRNRPYVYKVMAAWSNYGSTKY